MTPDLAGRPESGAKVALESCGAHGDLMAPRRHQILVPDNVLGDGIFPLKFGGALLVKTVVCRGKDTFDLVSDNPAYSNGHVDLTKDGDHLSVVRESPPIGARF